MKKSILLLAMVIVVIIGLSGNALALKIDLRDRANVAWHENNPEWVLAWENNGSLPYKIKMKGFKFLTGKAFTPDTNDLWQGDTRALILDSGKGKLNKWAKKAAKKGVDPVTFINDKLAAKMWKVKIKETEDGPKLIGKVAFTTYENPGGTGINGDGGNSTPSNSVPEPATLVLLGAGLLGLSVLRRSRFKTE